MPKRAPLAERFWAKVTRAGGCWEFAGLSTHSAGYRLLWTGDGSRSYQQAHRVSWELHYGPIPAGMLVCHHCDNRICVRPDHLFLGSIQDNMDDRNMKQRQARGERLWSAKLTADDVLEIRRRYAAGGVLIRELAEEFGMSYPGIQHITSGRKWRHLLERAA